MPASICFVILAHNDAATVARLAKLLLAADGQVAIHFDLNANEREFASLRAELGSDAERVIWPKRVRVAWGEWSIVQATLNALEAVAAAGPPPDFVHLMSGSDYPIRPIREFREYLSRNPTLEHMECVDISVESWVTGGLSHERYEYRHYFNWKAHPKLFDKCWTWQRKIGWRRRFVTGLRPHMGSQWWTLSWRSVEKALAAGRNRRLSSFFRTVWIPDEMFFQSVVGGVDAALETAPILTLYQFTGDGVPVVYYNDHAEYLARQPFFFARKLSPFAHRLRDDLDMYVSGKSLVTAFPDAAFGTRTDEYKRYLAKSEKPKADRRLLGYEKDSWRGDLVYQQKPVLAIFGASVSELKAIAALLNRSGCFVCHGPLFNPYRIEFAGEAPSYAGYRSDDVALRDDSRPNFLYAVAAEAAEDEGVGFLAPWGMDDHMRSRMLWCSFSRTLIVRGNPVRAFLELADGADHVEEPNDPSDMTTVQDFQEFHKSYQEYYGLLCKEFRDAGAIYEEIDLLSRGCMRAVVDFLKSNDLISSDPDDRRATSLTQDALAEQLRASGPRIEPAQARRLAETVPETRERHALLRTYAREIFRDADRPLILLCGASRDEVQLVADALEYAGVATKLAAEPLAKRRLHLNGGSEPTRRTSAALRMTGSTGGTSVSYAWDDAAGVVGELVAWAAGASVVVVTGNILRAFAQYNARTGTEASQEDLIHEFDDFFMKYKDYHRRWNEECADAKVDRLDLDLMSASWLRDLLGFYEALDAEQRTRQLVLERMADMDDPAEGLEFASQIISAFESKEQRQQHMAALRRRPPARNQALRPASLR